MNIKKVVAWLKKILRRKKEIKETVEDGFDFVASALDTLEAVSGVLDSPDVVATLKETDKPEV